MTVPKWMFLIMCTVIGYQEVTSLTTPQMFSSDIATPVTSIVDTSVRPQLNCSLVSVDDVQHRMEEYLQSGAKLVELNLTLEGYEPNFLKKRLQGVVTPNVWDRSSGRQGKNLLVLESTYDFPLLLFLRIGVHEMNVALKDSPADCLLELNETETLTVIRTAILNDFHPLEERGNKSLSVKGHVCNKEIKKDGEYAKFPYVCCHKNLGGDVVCEEASDSWVKTLETFIFVVSLLVVLFIPYFLPDSVYRPKFFAKEYIYRIPDNMPAKQLKVVVTKEPASYGNQDKVVRLSELKGMTEFKTLVKNKMTHNTTYKVTCDKIRLLVKSRLLLQENHVPVGLLQNIYDNLVLCRIRHQEPLKTFSSTNNIGWVFKFLKFFAQLIMLGIIFSPYIIWVCIYIYIFCEESTRKDKIQMAEEMGLKANFRSESPTNVLFIAGYVVVGLTIVIYHLLNKQVKKINSIIWNFTFHYYTEWLPSKLVAHCIQFLGKPFKMCGRLCWVLFVPYLVVVLPVVVVVLSVFLLPVFKLSVRAFVHIMILTKFFKNPEILLSSEAFKDLMESNKTVVKQIIEECQVLSKKDMIPLFILIVPLLVGYTYVTYLLMSCATFYIETGAYLLMGIITNAGITVPYFMVAILMVMYWRSSLNDVWGMYLSYHKKIHSLLHSMKSDEINALASQDTVITENTALRVQGENEINALASQDTVDTENTALCEQGENDSDISLIVEKGRPVWRMPSTLMFMDCRDTSYIPKKFFNDVISLNCHGVPGSPWVQYMRSFWRFSRIFLFLLFVFFVVMALGDTYKMSLTNQLLIYLASGLIPFLFRSVFSSSGSSSLHTDSIHFQAKIDKIIKNFKQDWPVTDITPKNPDVVVPAAGDLDMIIDVSQSACQNGDGTELESVESRPDRI